MSSLVVRRAGPQTTVQDLGRGGYLGDGIPPSGAFDATSLAIANVLVGNPPGDRYLVGRDPGAAGLEVLLGGAVLEFVDGASVAVTGADAAIEIDRHAASMWEMLRVPAGGVLRIGRTRGAARVYVAVAGGIDVPLVLGSRATHARAGLGGLDGRALLPGDVLPIASARGHVTGSADARGAAPIGAVELDRAIAPDARPQVSGPWRLGVTLGPQAELFTDESVAAFLQDEWRVSPLADRMGCRFEGRRLTFKPRTDALAIEAGSDPSNIVDDVTPLGGIQVPSGAELIAMGVDFPSIGGYAKIGTVVSAHIRRLGQLRPGDVVRFEALGVDEAVQELRKSLAIVETCAAALA